MVSSTYEQLMYFKINMISHIKINNIYIKVDIIYIID